MSKNIKKGTAIVSVTFIVLVAKILGFIKQMVCAAYYGATIQTDVITISEGLISNTDYLLIQTLTTALIPTYIHVKETGRVEEKRFISNTIFVFLTISAFISILLYITAPFISQVLAPTYSEEYSIQVSHYIRILCPVVIAMVLSAIFNSILKGNESFIPGEMMGVTKSLILIVLTLGLGNIIGPDLLVYGFALYALTTLIYLGAFSKRLWSLQIRDPFRDGTVLKLLKMMGPLLLGYSTVFISQLVDKAIVSGLKEGSVTAMGYASVLSNLVCTFIGTVCGVLFVYITQMIAGKQQYEAAHFIVLSTIRMVTIVLPVCILTICNSKDIVAVVYGHGKFDSGAVSICSYALIGYAFMFIPYILRELFSRFHYGYGDSKLPMINSTVGIVVNVVASIILSRFWGVLGVTIATSGSVLICGLLNIMTSARHNSHLNFKLVAPYILPWLAGSVICIVTSLGLTRIMGDFKTIIRLTVVFAVSLGIYYCINYRSVKPLILSLLQRK